MSSVGVYEYSSTTASAAAAAAQNLHNSVNNKPMSKTMQYRKVMKPLLERKRRARINKCLDELKDLMISALAMDEENVSKLEKADILEITVGHLQKLKRQRQLSYNPVLEADRFRAGYTSCAKEVSKVLASNGVDVELGTNLMTHLGYQLNELDQFPPRNNHNNNNDHSEPLTVKVGPTSDFSERSYNMPLTPPSSRGSPSPISSVDSEKVWRPW